MIAALNAHLEAFPNWAFEYLDINYDEETKSVWMVYKADSPNCYTLGMLHDAIKFRDLLRALFSSPLRERRQIRYLVMASKKPDVFSLGGDLATFASAVRRRDRRALLEYAYACIDVMYALTSAFDLPIVTLSAVRGQCLGGGFEGALATDFLIAETSAKLGVPEIAFNTFPGMGAVTFLRRRVGEAFSEQIISSGAVRSAGDLYKLGIVDVIAPEGSLFDTTLEWMREEGEERWRRRRLFAQHRRRCFPISRSELIEIVELWTDCCFSISDQDLRHMERLVAAQSRMKNRDRPNKSRSEIVSGEILQPFRK